MAVQVAKQVRGISLILSPESRLSDAEARAKIDHLVGELANLTTRGTLFTKVIRWASRRTPIPAYIRLFHPERLATRKRQHKARRSSSHSAGWHKSKDDHDLVMYPLKSPPIPRRFRPRKRIGWLAHYNAACFYSLALQLKQGRLPFDYKIGAWKTDCTRAAIRELGHVRRDPLNRLEPEWYRSDPELQPLTDCVKRTRWAKLVGL